MATPNPNFKFQIRKFDTHEGAWSDWEDAPLCDLLELDGFHVLDVDYHLTQVRVVFIPEES